MKPRRQKRDRWRNNALPKHMRSLQRCTCWAMRGMDDNTYPDPKCPKCGGAGQYVWRMGEPCDHPGCLHHVSHPCEGCGRTAGQYSEK